MTKTEANVEKIRKIYSWEIIIEQYLNHFLEIYKKDKVLHNA
ncbi:hypothetical protein ACFFJX_00910 [Pseudarcicella hirudinis]